MNDVRSGSGQDDVEKRCEAALAAFKRSGMLNKMADAVGADPNAALGRALNECVDRMGKIHKSLEPVVCAWVEAALAAGADPLARDSLNGSTYLASAVHRGSESSARALARVARVGVSTATFEDEASLLCITVRAGMEDLTRELLGGMKTDAQRSKASSQALLWASGATGSAICQALLDAGADPNSTNSRGVPVFWLAARDGPFTLLAALLAHGVSPDSATPMHGSTPLMAAVESNHLEAISLLLKAGADMDIRDRQGETAESLGLKMGPKNEKKIGPIFAAERARREAEILNKDLRTPRNRSPSRVL